MDEPTGEIEAYLRKERLLSFESDVEAYLDLIALSDPHRERANTREALRMQTLGQQAFLKKINDIRTILHIPQPVEADLESMSFDVANSILFPPGGTITEEVGPNKTRSIPRPEPATSFPFTGVCQVFCVSDF